MATTSFVLKNLRADEHRLVIGDDMATLGDLRKFVGRTFLLPPHIQKFICDGRGYDEQDNDSLSLEEILDGTEEGPDQDRYIWLLWMSDDDYAVVVGRGGMFLESELDDKRRAADLRNERHWEYVRLRSHRTLAQTTAGEHSRYCRQLPGWIRRIRGEAVW